MKLRWLTLTAALTGALCLPMAAGAFPRFERESPVATAGHPVRGEFPDVNQDTAALFIDSPSQRFAGETVYFGILRGAQRTRPVGGVMGVVATAGPTPVGTAPEPLTLGLIAGSVALLAVRFRSRKS